MSKSQSIPNIDDLSLYDSEEEVPVDTPAHRKTKSRDANGAPADNTSGASKQRPESKYTAEEAREAALRKELESVRNINKVIEDVVSSLEKAKSNMDTVHRTVTSASTLLNTWTRILSQTEHNQRLILNPNWHGASQDLADIESEAFQRQQAAEQSRIHEQMRREAAARKAEEEESRRAEAGSRPASGARGRGRGVRGGRASAGGAAGRGAGAGAGSGSGSGYVGVGGQGGRGSGRTTPGTGRGASGIPGRGTRGRGRGVG
ncbi:hypothetical protein W97_04030 [Coniosporium apollinis CBS 100218]|uniref:DASH complex subunit DUO1 n=1 Tax=Coniosporium apollinis (strain CBS 100218) TaxID=1168221 RepID=R7YS90_CONA1|nr:uncharacterized protein W97_04030 [Coniosporium apollinis CBS 100218]EON64797.1 hypothetical protein W97_04030 [Coniosporium apollinis CBS 100218]